MLTTETATRSLRAGGEGLDARCHLYGQRLKAVRIALGYDVARDFCRAVNRAAGLPPDPDGGLLSAQRLNNYELGRNYLPMRDDLAPVLIGLGVSMDFIITGRFDYLPATCRARAMAELRAIQAGETMH